MTEKGSPQEEHFLGDSFSDEEDDKDQNTESLSSSESKSTTGEYSESSYDSEEDSEGDDIDYRKMIETMKNQLQSYKDAVEEDRQRDKARICRLESDLEDERDSNESLKNKIQECVGTIKQLIGELKNLKNEKEDLMTRIDEETKNHIQTIKELQTIKQNMNDEQLSLTGKRELEVLLRVTMEGMKIEKVDAVQNRDTDREDLVLQKNILEKKVMESTQNLTLEREKMLKEKGEIENKLKEVTKNYDEVKNESDKLKEKIVVLENMNKQNKMINNGNYQENMMVDALAIVNRISGEGHFREVSRVSIQDLNRYVKEEVYFPRMFMKIEDDCVRVLQNSYRKWSSNNKSVLEGNEKIPLLTFIMHYAQSKLYGDYLKKKNDKVLEYFDLLESICNFTKKYSLDPNVKKVYGENKLQSNINFVTEPFTNSKTIPDKSEKIIKLNESDRRSSVSSRVQLHENLKTKTPTLAFLDKGGSRASLPNKVKPKRSETLVAFFKSSKDNSGASTPTQELNKTSVNPSEDKISSLSTSRSKAQSKRGTMTPIAFDELVGQIELHEKVEKSKGDVLKMPGEVNGMVQYKDKIYIAMSCFNDSCIGWLRCIDAKEPTKILSTNTYNQEIIKMKIFNEYLYVSLKNGKILIFNADTFKPMVFEDSLHPGVVDFFSYKDSVYLLLISSEFVRYTIKEDKITTKILKYKGIPVAGKQLLVKDDILMVCTNSGISKFDLKSKSALKKEEQIQLKTSHISVIDNTLWAFYPDLKKLNVYNDKLQILKSFDFDDVVFIIECGNSVWVGLNTNQLNVIDSTSYEITQTFDLSTNKDVSLITGLLVQVGNPPSAIFQFWASTDDLQIHFLQTTYKSHAFIPSVEEAPKCVFCKKAVKQKDSFQCIRCKLVIHKSCDPYKHNIQAVCRGKPQSLSLQLSQGMDTDSGVIMAEPSPRRKNLQKRLNRSYTIKPVSGGISFPDDWK
ncbi:hypothetical protein ENUP19_0126G0065 [Entamoeba nuttalli]